MSSPIDCSVMSHPACHTFDDAWDPLPVPGGSTRIGQPPATADPPLVGSYDCINDCASSLGAVALVSSAVAGLGCYVLPPACPALIVAVPGTLLAACDAACRELESP